MINNNDMKNKGIRPRGITVIALLMILFGLAEVITSFTHTFFGITTSQATIFTYSAAAIGLFYIFAGSLIMTMKKWAAVIAIILLGADIAGRIALVAIGLYPLNSLEQIIGIIAGTAIAAIFAIYIGFKWNLFRSG